MNPIKYLHENGVKRAIKVLYDYKLELSWKELYMLCLNHKSYGIAGYERSSFCWRQIV